MIGSRLGGEVVRGWTLLQQDAGELDAALEIGHGFGCTDRWRARRLRAASSAVLCEYDNERNVLFLEISNEYCCTECNMSSDAPFS